MDRRLLLHDDIGIDVGLADGVHLWFIAFGPNPLDEQQIKLQCQVVDEVEGSRKPEQVTDISLVVDYEQGVAHEFSLSLSAVKPQRLGQKYAYGADVSPGARLYVEFTYKLDADGETFVLSEYEVGTKRTQVDRGTPGLVQPVDIDYPVLDVVPCEFGAYSVPYIGPGGVQKEFQFPRRVRGEKRKSQ